MNDRFVVRTVVVGLGLAVLACLVAAVVLALADKDYPEFLKYIGTTAIGLFGGILAKTSSEPQPVQVVDQPVATTEVPAQKRKRGDVGHGEAGGILYWALAALVVIVILVLLGVID